MSLQHEGPAPYTAPSAVMTVIDRSRQGTLPMPIDASVLTRIGISDSLAPRTVASLRLLELIEEDGQPTQTLQEFRRLPTDEFKPTVQKWLREVYGEVFEIIGDPTTADYQRVEDAFRHYTPDGQRPRMVTLFTGLLDFAGMLPENSPLKASTRSAQKGTVSRSRKPRTQRRVPEREEPAFTDATPLQMHPRSGSRPMTKAEMMDALQYPGMHPFIMGLIQTLPPAGAVWPPAKREAWLRAAGAAFDVIYELPGDDQEVMS